VEGVSGLGLKGAARCFPLRFRKPGEAPLPDKAASPGGIAVSIMGVEDERDVLDIMVQLLTLIFHGATVCGGAGRFDISHPADDEVRHLPYRSRMTPAISFIPTGRA